MKIFFKIVFILLLPFQLSAQFVSTVAGSYLAKGNKDTLAFSATFNSPHGIAIDDSGNIFIADRYNNVIRKLDINQNVTTVAGTGAKGSQNGNHLTATFNEPWGLCVDKKGNIYVADTRNNKIRKIATDGNVTTFAGNGSFGFADNANPLASTFGNPTDLNFDPDGNLIIVDHLTNLIRKIAPNGNVSTIAGTKANYPNNYGNKDGAGLSAQFYFPYGLTVDKAGNIFVADQYNHTIRKIDKNYNVTTVAGTGKIGNNDGIASQATFNYPWDVVTDSLNNIYVADGYNQDIRKITPTGIVSTLAGVPGKQGALDGPANLSTFSGATSLVINQQEQAIYVGDAYNNEIRKIIMIYMQQPISVAISSKSTTACLNDSVLITINATNSAFYEVYLNNQLVKQTTQSNVYVKNFIPGNNSIKVLAYNDTKTSSYASNTLAINTPTTPALKISKNKIPLICKGDTIQLTASGAAQPVWNNGLTKTTINVNNGGTFFFKTTLSNCIFYSDTLIVKSNPSPNISIDKKGKLTICQGDSIQINAQGDSTIFWQDNSKGNKYIAKTDGSYFAKTINKIGCVSYSDTVFIHTSIVAKPFIVSDHGFSFCKGDSLTLSSSKAATYLWSNGQNTKSIKINKAGIFNVTVADTINCKGISDDITIQEFTKPLISLSFKGDTIINKNNSITLIASGATKWYWSTGDTLSTITINQAGKYSVMGYNIIGCPSFSDTVNVRTEATVIVKVQVLGNTILCDGDSCKLGSTFSNNIQWYRNSNAIFNASKNIFTVKSTGTYFYTYVDAAGLKWYSDSVQIYVQPKPNVSILASNYQFSITNAQPVSFRLTTATVYDNYTWNFGDPISQSENNSAEATPSHRYTKPGVYDISVNITSGSCTSKILNKSFITVQPGGFIPNAFTPNGDGKNDRFRLLGQSLDNFTMEIYNQWGEQIFTTNDINLGWDGSTIRGAAETGTYVYVMYGTDINGQKVVYKGKVNVIK